MARTLALLYGLAAYLIFLASFLYAIGFVGDLALPKTIDSPPSTLAVRFLVDVLLLGLFAVQHSVMARQAFKRWWARFVPTHLERSTYVLISSLLLFLLYWGWQPLEDTIWDARQTFLRQPIWAIFSLGWLVILVSTFLIDHFDLFGLRQVYQYFRGKEYRPPAFKVTGLYRYIRHPIMLGFIVAFWAAPRMTAGHLLFSVLTTAYILVAVRLEERDLEAVHGDAYRDYKRRTPILLPLPRK